VNVVGSLATIFLLLRNLNELVLAQVGPLGKASPGIELTTQYGWEINWLNSAPSSLAAGVCWIAWESRMAQQANSWEQGEGTAPEAGKTAIHNLSYNQTT